MRERLGCSTSTTLTLRDRPPLQPTTEHELSLIILARKLQKKIKQGIVPRTFSWRTDCPSHVKRRITMSKEIKFVLSLFAIFWALTSYAGGTSSYLDDILDCSSRAAQDKRPARNTMEINTRLASEVVSCMYQLGYELDWKSVKWIDRDRKIVP